MTTSPRSDRRRADLEVGASIVEYALLVALAAVVCIAGVQRLGGSTAGRVDDVATGLTAGEDRASSGGGAAPGGGGGSAGGGDGGAPAATTTTMPTTTTTIPPTTTTTMPAAPADDEDGDAEMKAVSATALAGTLYWWDAWGQQGQWVAVAKLTNEWERGSFVTVQVTRVFGDGRTVTEVVENFYVPANGSASLQHWSNDLSEGSSRDVVAVRFKITGVRTSDLAWRTQSFVVDGGTVTATAPSVP